MQQPIDFVISARPRDIGGFTVRRVLPHARRRLVGPFIFFDHIGPAEFAPGEGIDVRPHPHIGLATVTYLFEGALGHKDTVGADIVIRPGAVNWMTAGRGIVHSERTPDEERAAGQRLHGIQTWVALPDSHAEQAPAFDHHPSDTLPEFEHGGARVKLLAGSAWGQTSPVSFPHPIWYLALETDNGAKLDMPQDVEERCVYVVSGRATLADADLSEGDMAILLPNAEAPLILEAGTKVICAGGAKLEGGRKIEWNLVALTQDRIDQAKADWRASAAMGWKDTVFELPDGETEFIPLPEDA